MLYFLRAPYDENRNIVRSDEDFYPYNKYILYILSVIYRPSTYDEGERFLLSDLGFRDPGPVY